MTGPEPAGGRFAGGGTETPHIVGADVPVVAGAGVCAQEGEARAATKPVMANARTVNMRMPQILSKRLSLQDFRRMEPADGRAGCAIGQRSRAKVKGRKSSKSCAGHDVRLDARLLTFNL